MSFLLRLTCNRSLLTTKCTNFIKCDLHSLQRFNLSPILGSNINKSPIRTFLLKPTRITWKMEDLKNRDNVPQHAELIYNNRMYKYIFGGQIMASLCLGVMILMLFTDGDYFTLDHVKDSAGEYVRETDYDTLILYGSLSILWAILQIMIQQLPIRIYRIPGQRKNIFVFYSKVPTAKKHVVCKDLQLEKLEPYGIMPWKYGRYHIKKVQNVILFDYYFRTSSDLNVMLGYELPSD